MRPGAQSRRASRARAIAGASLSGKGHGPSRRRGSEGKAGLAQERVDEAGSALDGPEPAADQGLKFVQGGRGVIAQAAFHTRPGALDRVEVGGVGGQVDDGEPVGVRIDEVAHLPTAVGVEVVPDEHDRGVEGSVRGGDQGGVVGLGHAGPVALAAAVNVDAVEEPARPAGLEAGHPSDRQAPGVAGHPGHRGAAAGRPGAGLARPQRLAGLVLEADPRAGQRR